MIGVVVGKVWSDKNSVLMEMNWLNVMLIVVPVVKFGTVAVFLSWLIVIDMLGVVAVFSGLVMDRCFVVTERP